MTDRLRSSRCGCEAADGAAARRRLAWLRLSPRRTTSACSASSSTSTSSSTRPSTFAARARRSSCIAPTLAIVLPVGISFYTFQSMSYTIDVYRRRAAAGASLPRLRALRRVLPAARRRPDRARDRLPAAARSATRSGSTTSTCAPALTLFLIGFIKKACIADNIVADASTPVFARPGGRSSAVDLARGRAATRSRSTATSRATPTWRSRRAGLLGYELTLNFDFPYLATQHHRVLAALAHLAVDLAARLPLHPARRQPARRARARTATCMRDDAARRPVARRGWNFVVWGVLHGAVPDRAPLARRAGPAAAAPSATWRCSAIAVTLHLERSCCGSSSAATDLEKALEHPAHDALHSRAPERVAIVAA